VITMEILGRIRRMFLRDGLGYSEIARRTGIARNTVKRWLKGVAVSRRVTATESFASLVIVPVSKADTSLRHRSTADVPHQRSWHRLLRGSNKPSSQTPDGSNGIVVPANIYLSKSRPTATPAGTKG